MTISVSSGNFLFIIMAVILGVVILTMLLKKGDRNKKIISLIILIAVFIFLFISFGRPSEIVVNENGVNSDVYGKIAFNWRDVEKAIYIEDYQDSPYKPTLKINGTAVKGFRAGKFRLESGESVKIVTQNSEDAALFYTSGGTYLFAVDQLKALIDIAEDYIEVIY